MDQGDLDELYFSSYKDLSVHELMLKDAPRTEAYKNFIEKNITLFKDKVVLDVGAGTGILSLFAAKAGAKKVFAVEASGLASLCRNIVSVNGYDDVIEVIQSRVEDCQLPVDSVDIIVSEWMGFYLLHEAMLESVIFAREKWLSPDGMLVPSTATLYLCPLNLKTYVKDNFNVWDSLYGFDFSPLKSLVQMKHNTQPSVMTVDEKSCIAAPEEVTHLVLKYVESDDLRLIKRQLQFQISKHSVCHGFGAWFECGFEGDALSGHVTPVVLNTAPDAAPTHWQQTVVVLPEALLVSKDDLIGCSLVLEQDSGNRRHYNIAIEVDDAASDDDDETEDNDAASKAAGDTCPSKELTEAATLIAEKMGSK